MVFVDFCMGYAECPPYFYFRSSWATELQSVTCCVSHDESFHQVSTKFEVDTTTRYLVIELLLLIRYVTLTLTFWAWSTVIHGGSRDQPPTEFEVPTTICSWVMNCDISHGIPLTMRSQPLRVRRITWFMSRGKFSHTFEILDPDLPIHYTTFVTLRWRLRAVYS